MHVRWPFRGWNRLLILFLNYYLPIHQSSHIGKRWWLFEDIYFAALNYFSIWLWVQPQNCTSSKSVWKKTEIPLQYRFILKKFSISQFIWRCFNRICSVHFALQDVSDQSIFPILPWTLVRLWGKLWFSTLFNACWNLSTILYWDLSADIIYYSIVSICADESCFSFFVYWHCIKNTYRKDPNTLTCGISTSGIDPWWTPEAGTIEVEME